MLFDAHTGWSDTPAFMRLYVADADATYRRALDVGATSVTAVTDLDFGDRVGRVRDPLNNLWRIQTHVEDIDPPRNAAALAIPRQPAHSTTSRPRWDEAMRK
jgi:PhnB protein